MPGLAWKQHTPGQYALCVCADAADARITCRRPPMARRQSLSIASARTSASARPRAHAPQASRGPRTRARPRRCASARRSLLPAAQPPTEHVAFRPDSMMIYTLAFAPFLSHNYRTLSPPPRLVSSIVEKLIVGKIMSDLTRFIQKNRLPHHIGGRFTRVHPHRLGQKTTLYHSCPYHFPYRFPYRFPYHLPCHFPYTHGCASGGWTGQKRSQLSAGFSPQTERKAAIFRPISARFLVWDALGWE